MSISRVLSSPRTDVPGALPQGLFAYGRQVDSWIVQAVKPITYEVRFSDDVLNPGHTDLLDAAGPAVGDAPRRFVVVDKNVERLFGQRIRAYFDHHRADYRLCVVHADETVKEFDTAARLVQEIDAFGIDRRNEPVIVIGGGVLMDIVGLVGSLYRRGTPFVRVPTTLIGLVDAGVGVKTGVNFNGNKNRLGTYFAAELTLLDRTFLATLGERHLSNGLAEILKIALVKDADLFDLLRRHGAQLLRQRFQGDTPDGEYAATSVLRRAIQGMLEELQPNLWETELERVVDYGHTFSPTIEMRALPTLLHGEAVGIDMALTTVLARRRGLVSDAEQQQIFALMTTLRLPLWNDLLTTDVLAEALRDTVRHRGGLQRLPLPAGIGDVRFVNDVTDAELAGAVDELFVQAEKVAG